MNFTFFIYLFLNQFIFAANISFIGPCEEMPLVTHSMNISEGSSVGQFTIKTLEKLGIPYSGADRGMNSIFNTPTGMEAYEIISKSEMLAYGWCYSVNGLEPNLYPDEVSLNEQDSILWWFGYAHYKEGEWISQCTPSYLRSSPQFCPFNQN